MVHDLADLLGMGLAERTAEHGEILAEDEDLPTVHRAPAGHHPVAGNHLLAHAEIVAAVLDEHVPFLEGLGIEQYLDPFARGQLAFLVLGLDTLLAAAGAGLLALFLKPLDDFLHRRPLPLCRESATSRAACQLELRSARMEPQ